MWSLNIFRNSPFFFSFLFFFFLRNSHFSDSSSKFLPFFFTSQVHLNVLHSYFSFNMLPSPLWQGHLSPVLSQADPYTSSTVQLHWGTFPKCLTAHRDGSRYLSYCAAAAPCIPFSQVQTFSASITCISHSILFSKKLF